MLEAFVRCTIGAIWNDQRATIAAQADTIRELQNLLTATNRPAIEAVRDLAKRSVCSLGKELGVSIDDASQLGIIAARVLRRAEDAAAIRPNAA